MPKNEKRLQDAEYTALRENYQKSLLNSLKEYGQKKIVGIGGLTQSTVSGYVSRGSVPDVVLGAMIAKQLGRKVEEMVYSIIPEQKKTTQEIQNIIDLLAPHADNDRLLIKLSGVIEHYLDEHAVAEAQKREMA